MRPNIEEIRNNTVFGVGREEDVPTLLAYIDELENMPLVQTVVKLRKDFEIAYQTNSDMALTLIEKSNEIERLREALEVANDCLFGNTYGDKVLEEAYQVISKALEG